MAAAPGSIATVPRAVSTPRSPPRLTASILPCCKPIWRLRIQLILVFSRQAANVPLKAELPGIEASAGVFQEPSDLEAWQVQKMKGVALCTTSPKAIKVGKVVRKRGISTAGALNCVEDWPSADDMP